MPHATSMQTTQVNVCGIVKLNPRISTWMHATPEQRTEYIAGNESLVDHLGGIVRKYGGLSESEIISECANSENPQYFSPSEFFRILDDLEESDMTLEELLSEKYCVQCKHVVKTYWELESCDKNPKGLLEEPKPHGNEIQGTPTCEDDYCNPKYTKLNEKEITKEYILQHSVFERCSICNQFMESQ